MKLFGTLFDIALLPVAIVKDSIMIPVKYMSAEDDKSETRKQVEKIDDDIKE